MKKKAIISTSVIVAAIICVIVVLCIIKPAHQAKNNGALPIISEEGIRDDIILDEPETEAKDSSSSVSPASSVSDYEESPWEESLETSSGEISDGETAGEDSEDIPLGRNELPIIIG